MGIPIEGATGNAVEAGVAASAPLHVVSKPTGHGALGHYRFSVVTGTLAAALAANAVVFSARWGDATRFACVTKLRTRFMPLTPFTANTLTDHTSFDLVIGRSFSAAHTGGTGLTLTGDNQAMRASMGASLFSDVRIATTAALAGGTVTLDSHPIAQSLRKGNRVNPAAATEEIVLPPTDGINFEVVISNGEHPIILSQNEGLIVRNRTVWPAAGTGILLVEMAWAEVTAY